MSTASPLSIPVGEYELLEGVDHDSVSELWIARSMANPARIVRLLRLKRDVVDNAAIRDAFQTTLRAAARTRSPLALRVLAVGGHDDDVYAVLEHLEGVTLTELLDVTRDAGEPLPLGVALRIGLDVAAALETMHAAHGDLTPRSVYLTAGGIALVSPTGLAVAACGGPKEGSLRRLAYKAPEQIASAKAAKGDARADVYALAAILVEAIEGRPVIVGTTAEAILESMATAAPPALDVPAKLATVLRRALSRDPAARYPDVGEFARAAEGAVGELLADRREVTDAFWRLVGNDVAARRFELQSIVESDEAANPELDLARLQDMERAAERAAESFREEVASVPPQEPAEAEAAEAGPSARESDARTEGDDSAEDREPEPRATRESGVVEAREASKPAKTRTADKPAKREEPAPTKKKATPASVVTRGAPTEPRARPRAAAVERPPPSERAVQNRKLVVGVVIAGAALLLLGLLVHGTGKPEESSAPPAATDQQPPSPKAAAPAVPTQAALPTAEPTATATATAAGTTSAEAPEPSAEPAAPEQATAEPAATDESGTTAEKKKKKKKKWIPLPTATATSTAPAQTATAAPTATTPPVARFGAVPPGGAPKPAPAPAPPGIPGGI